MGLKLGGDGALVSTRQGVVRHDGFPARVVDTTGAGNAFNAGYLRAMHDGGSLQDCLALGNACGALTAGAMGGTGAGCTVSHGPAV